jgi:branched-chain amino acid transport system permease protein/neutral amino acid transport system permease protein
MSIFVASIGFGLVTASIVALAAVGFTMQFAVTKIINLAYGDVMTASAFIAYVCNSAGVNIWVCLAVGALFGGAASVALNRLIYRPFARHGANLLTLIIVTLAVALIIQNVVQAIWGPNFFSYTMSVGRSVNLGDMTFTLSQLGIIAVSLVAMFGIHLLLAYTRLGKAMRATAANAALARSCGIRTERIVDIAWMISGALCGASGVVLVMNTTSFTATTGANFLLIIAAAAIVGGVGRPYGAMIGAVVIGLGTEVSAVFVSPSYKDVVAFVILVLVLLFRPQGVIPGASSAGGAAA